MMLVYIFMATISLWFGTVLQIPDEYTPKQAVLTLFVKFISILVAVIMVALMTRL